ncbi:TetR/AcrR family transcriptional regulator [Mycolicibacterium sp. XJ662]
MQSDTGNERDCIIEAAYRCLSEPHSGAIPVAAILACAGVSTRAFYRHFQSKDELFLAMLCQETDALAERLDRITSQFCGRPAAQLAAWIDGMFALITDEKVRAHFTVIDTDEVRAARGYRETREKAHSDRERSLVEILRRGRDDGTFPLADPEPDAVAINAVVSRVLPNQSFHDLERVNRAKDQVLDFALRALGAERHR